LKLKEIRAVSPDFVWNASKAKNQPKRQLIWDGPNKATTPRALPEICESGVRRRFRSVPVKSELYLLSDSRQLPSKIGHLYDGVKMQVTNCPEYERLSSSVDQILRDLSEKTTLHLELFRSKQHEKFMHLDKELELLVGEQERAIGSLRQHAKDHQCQKAA